MEIILQGLGKSFGNVKALKSIDITIPSGKFTTLLGPSGCGKTTLLRVIAGLETPDNGEISFEDRSIFSTTRKINVSTHRRNLGMVFQDFALWPHMTVFENIAFSLKATGKRKNLKEKVLHALEVVRLQGMENRYPHQLSGGQEQRVSFARAIVNEPKIILFDEPLSALDAILRDEMRVELTTLVHSMGVTAVYVTHDQTEAMTMSDQIIVMNQGEILQIGTPEEIYLHPKDVFVAKFVGKSNWYSGERQMIRPEEIHWTRAEEKMELLNGKVKSVGYMGERYEIYIEVEGLGEWIVYDNKRLSIGENVSFYVSSDKIYQF